MRAFASLALTLSLASFAPAQEREQPAPAPVPATREPATRPTVELNDLEKRFEQSMAGVTLVGRFSTHGKEDAVPKEDRYAISKVTKIGQDLWLFTARVGDSKLPIPLPLPVKWAGDTPVITMTKVAIPTMGTFTARVLIYDDHYAGTWDAGDHGGHLWGRIERGQPEAKQ
jgi:hypothetical protein